MAVPEQTPYIEHTGNGVTTSFALEFQCESKDHLIVLVDDIEPPIATWSLTGGNVVFTTAPAAGKKITLQRNTPFNRTTDYQSYNNSFRPPAVNKDFDWIWWKLQELGVGDWLLKLYVDRLHGEQKNYIDKKDTQLQENISNLASYVGQKDVELQGNIDNLKDYVDDKDDELRAYLLAEIQAQGVALDQLDEYYNYLMQRLAQIAVDGGWDSSFVVHKDTNQYEINEFVYPKLQRENVSVWDFFTPAELGAYKASPTTFDAARPINEFFAYISANDVGTAYCSGVFSVSQTIRIGRSGVQNTKIVQGRLVLKDLIGLDTLAQSETGGHFNWEGTIDVTGNFTGSAWTYTNRKTRIGFRFLGSSANGRSNYGNIRAQFFRQAGVYAEDKTTLSLTRRIYANGIGTGYRNSQYTTTWSNLVNTGSQGSLSQRSTITVATLPESDLDCQMYVYNEGVLHLIHDIDRVNSTITVHPWIVTSNTSGTLEYIWGAGLDVRGSDSSAFHADVLDVTNSAIGLVARSLYLPSVSECCIQSTRLGITQGANATSAGSGGYIGNYYTEGMLFDLVFVSTYGADGRLPILSSYESRIDRTTFIGPRTGNGSYGMSANTATGFQYNYKGYNYYCESQFQQFKSSDSSNIVPIDLFSANLWRQVYYKNTLIFQLGLFTDANIMKARMFGISTGLIHVIGTGATGTPTSITFPASTDNSYTLNGGNTDLVFTSFNGPAEFAIYMEINTKNYVIRQVGAVSGGASVTYDPPSLTNGTQQSTTVALTGAKLGDMVACSFDKALNGTRIWAEVTSANLVTVYHQNPTATPVDIGTGTLRVKLI